MMHAVLCEWKLPPQRYFFAGEAAGTRCQYHMPSGQYEHRHGQQHFQQQATTSSSSPTPSGSCYTATTLPPQAPTRQQHHPQHHPQHHQRHQPQQQQWCMPPPPVMPTYNFIMEPSPSNSREMRNRAEKMRRDKLNSYIGELAALVPMISSSAKKMDKTSILRLAATHLRIHSLINGRVKKDFPLDHILLEQLMYEQLGGFMLILTTTGKIVFISHTVEQLLGHLQTDLMGQSIFNILHENDMDRLRLILGTDNGETEWRKYFDVRLARAGPRTEKPTYEPVNMMGISGSQANSTRSRDAASNTSSSEVLIFFARLFRPTPMADRLLEANKDEYITRHLVDGQIINCDQRISLVAGYMIEEVIGLSAFAFMHREDVRWTIIALRQMYDRGESRGSSCYRLLSRTGEFIYLRTVGFLELDSNGVVESFVCINTLVSEDEGFELIRDMKERFSALIKVQPNQILEGSDVSSDTVESSVQLEAAIKHLITNLPSPGCDARSTPSPRSITPVTTHENQDCNAIEHKTTTAAPTSSPTPANNNKATSCKTTGTASSEPSAEPQAVAKLATARAKRQARAADNAAVPQSRKRHKAREKTPEPQVPAAGRRFRPNITEIMHKEQNNLYQSEKLFGRESCI